MVSPKDWVVFVTDCKCGTLFAPYAVGIFYDEKHARSLATEINETGKAAACVLGRYTTEQIRGPVIPNKVTAEAVDGSEPACEDDSGRNPPPILTHKWA